ncbi:uncharacterized protein MONOS_10809 [Monocercomonoides exilis]|uniref:uncharacterized protein n=1 Tax=Monocercomonoides exilis TaxID=2049356 RepID=UPI00355AB268|nr:hypothetical protein MONOS_10809 [Monocercomonoides exilis]|eukprot:MONOS_10809.2-p1 / transcript=MONOS_10809.2 / gene=MONOS_10809 / organism=Monocercomonoides_exilis_PA203 / gene_product=unspecified product / transcript_product=unspecified product / location=Mono_scaffold00506:32198-33755(-) / protein_length=432 / sequence_SO=supercontig / SO=protein_coding / is_pseudo=false
METDNTKKFNELFSELEHYDEDKQRKKIGETNEIIDGMNEEEFRSIFRKRMFYKIDKMIEEKKMSIENAILLLKHAGCCIKLKNVWNPCFDLSSLGERFKKMIVEEEEKEKGKKNEKLLADLCECYLLFHFDFSSNLISICVSCLLNVASKKEKNEETQKEVEMALLALSHINTYSEIEQEIYLNEIKEIIQYHQVHRSLTCLGYQSAWQFFISRFYTNGFLKDTVANELHFAREAERELEELTRCLDWYRKEDGKEENEAKEVLVIGRWIQTLLIYFQCRQLPNEERVDLFSRIVQIYRAAKDNYEEISRWCIYPLRSASERGIVKIDDLLKGGAADAVLEGIQRPTLNEGVTYECLHFFKNVSYRLKGKEKSENDEIERKATKRKVFEKTEEEGYEDTITSIHEISGFLYRKYFDPEISLNISDYFVNI